mgnify:CR=1 FL=1
MISLKSDKTFVAPKRIWQPHSRLMFMPFWFKAPPPSLIQDSPSAFLIQMVSGVDTAKRMLVTLLKSLAGIYGVVLVLTRESTDKEVKVAYKKVSRKTHPDQGGQPERQKALNAARDTKKQ